MFIWETGMNELKPDIKIEIPMEEKKR